MKVLATAVCLLAIGIVASTETHQFEISLAEFIASNVRFIERQNRIAANANDYVDKILLKFGDYVITKGLDPLHVDDISDGFSVKIGPINFHGDLKLTNGWLQGLSTLYRSDDATVEYVGQLLNLRLPVAFNTLNINFDYSISIMNIGPIGGLEGKINGVSIYVDINVDTVTTEITLQKFQIVNAGTIDVHFSGHPLVDWLINIVTKVATTLLHNVVINIVENKVHDLIQNTIDEFNNRTLYNGPSEFSLLYK